jgi:hypothetical protein
MWVYDGEQWVEEPDPEVMLLAATSPDIDPDELDQAVEELEEERCSQK